MGMQHISDQFKKNMQKKKLTKQSVGAYILQFLKKKVHYPEETTGVLKEVVFTLKCAPKEDKTKLFHQREQFMKTINDRLKEIGYNIRLQDLRIK